MKKLTKEEYIRQFEEIMAGPKPNLASKLRDIVSRKK